MSVPEKVIESCRQALLAGTAIIHIKTDSENFIRSLLCCKEHPLIVHLDEKGRLLSQKSGSRLEDSSNFFKGTLPEAGSENTYTGLTAAGDYTPKGPCVWTYWLGGKSEEELEECFRHLENYVRNHEDSSHVQYDILQSSMVIVYSSRVMLPENLAAYCEYIDIPCPDEEEIRDIIKQQAGEESEIVKNEEYLQRLCNDFLGFTTEEISLAMRRIIRTEDISDDSRVRAAVFESKKRKLTGGLLECCESYGDIGGMGRYTQWLEKQINPLTQANAYMKAAGTVPPKGVLMCGIPGCGKSEAAKYTARALGLELIKLDIGSLVNKYQGVSEQHMREALDLAQTMSPCVLWIDEIEKGFSGASSDDESSMRRMFGYMLTWMQEKKFPCFIFAAANDIGALPKEFFRSGRFEALFAAYLPTAAECAQIFLASMRRARANIVQARNDPDAVLFEKECEDAQIYIDFVNRNFAKDASKPRIVIGSDIQKIVDNAVRYIYENKNSPDALLISEDEWKNALEKAADPEDKASFSAYADGQENLRDIAARYCRLLRKGFVPASADALFDSADYHIEEVFRLTEDENSAAEFFTGEISGERGPYDRAVYNCLKKEINTVAPEIEKYELRKLAQGR